MATLEKVYVINNYGFQILNNSSLLRSGSLTNMYLIALKRKLPNKKVNAHRLPLDGDFFMCHGLISRTPADRF